MPLIVSDQGLSKDFIPKYVLNHGNYNIVATYNLLYNASLMVREGIGYALCLDKLVNTDCMSELCFRPLEPKSEAKIIFVWKKYQLFSKTSQYFLSLIQKIFTSKEGHDVS